MSDTNTIVKLNPTRVLIVLLAIIVLLVGFSIWGQSLRLLPTYFDIRGPWHEFVIDLLIHAFYLDNEGNIPTYFNTILLFVPAILLGLISMWKSSVRDKFRFQWWGLALLFLLLSMDEAAVLHERLIKPMSAITEARGAFYFGWVVPGAAFVMLLALAYIPFFLKLEDKFKLLFLVSMALYFGGAIGGEIVSGYFAQALGQKNFTYAVIASIEESVEMIGASLLIFSLLKYLEHYLPEGIVLKV